MKGIVGLVSIEIFALRIPLFRIHGHSANWAIQTLFKPLTEKLIN
jgi:hypothetical protein